MYVLKIRQRRAIFQFRRDMDRDLVFSERERRPVEWDGGVFSILLSSFERGFIRYDYFGGKW
jgi:hypothetical protein